MRKGRCLSYNHAGRPQQPVYPNQGKYHCSGSRSLPQRRFCINIFISRTGLCLLLISPDRGFPCWCCDAVVWLTGALGRFRSEHPPGVLRPPSYRWLARLHPDAYTVSCPRAVRVLLGCAEWGLDAHGMLQLDSKTPSHDLWFMPAAWGTRPLARNPVFRRETPDTSIYIYAPYKCFVVRAITIYNSKILSVTW